MCTLQLTASGCVSTGLCQHLAHTFPPNRNTGDAGGRGPRAGHAASPVSAAAVFLHPCLLHTSSPPKRSKAGSAHSAAQIQAASGLLGGDEQGQTCRKSMGEERRAPPLHAREGLEGVDK